MHKQKKTQSDKQIEDSALKMHSNGEKKLLLHTQHTSLFEQLLVILVFFVFFLVLLLPLLFSSNVLNFDNFVYTFVIFGSGDGGKKRHYALTYNLLGG